MSGMNQKLEVFKIKVLLVDDQNIIGEALRRMLNDQSDIAFNYCSDPSKAIDTANEMKPTVILQDLVMPNIDGLTLVKLYRENPATKDVPLIVLSTKEDPKIKAEAFRLGANDYLVKLPDKVELIARIRYHSAAYIRLLERNEAYEKLAESQKILQAELNEAAAYVRSLLPAPQVKDGISISWRFIPSTMLGGDAFGYHWLDPDRLALYLLDVCGHGVGAALLSISVINVLRFQSLPNTNFYEPASVLKSLNETFQMEKHNNMFLTIWYGVYDKKKREIVSSSGGHPPAVLLRGEDEHTLKTIQFSPSGFVIGCMPGAEYESESYQLGKYNKLFIFSDGVYEIRKPDGKILTYEEFLKELDLPSVKEGMADLDRILQFSRSINGPGPFTDDVSLLEVLIT